MATQWRSFDIDSVCHFVDLLAFDPIASVACPLRVIALASPCLRYVPWNEDFLCVGRVVNLVWLYDTLKLQPDLKSNMMDLESAKDFKDFNRVLRRGYMERSGRAFRNMRLRC